MLSKFDRGVARVLGVRVVAAAARGLAQAGVADADVRRRLGRVREQLRARPTSPMSGMSCAFVVPQALPRARVEQIVGEHGADRVDVLRGRLNATSKSSVRELRTRSPVGHVRRALYCCDVDVDQRVVIARDAPTRRAGEQLGEAPDVVGLDQQRARGAGVRCRRRPRPRRCRSRCRRSRTRTSAATRDPA